MNEAIGKIVLGSVLAFFSSEICLLIVLLFCGICVILFFSEFRIRASR